MQNYLQRWGLCPVLGASSWRPDLGDRRASYGERPPFKRRGNSNEGCVVYLYVLLHRSFESFLGVIKPTQSSLAIPFCSRKYMRKRNYMKICRSQQSHYQLLLLPSLLPSSWAIHVLFCRDVPRSSGIHTIFPRQLFPSALLNLPSNSTLI
jgi:hypothetical protein